MAIHIATELNAAGGARDAEEIAEISKSDRHYWTDLGAEIKEQTGRTEKNRLKEHCLIC